ncbi:hypothetical protein SCYAM73S_08584 [Streptomyces cyaneofuscatus]
MGTARHHRGAADRRPGRSGAGGGHGDLGCSLALALHKCYSVTTCPSPRFAATYRAGCGTAGPTAVRPPCTCRLSLGDCTTPRCSRRRMPRLPGTCGGHGHGSPWPWACALAAAESAEAGGSPDEIVAAAESGLPDIPRILRHPRLPPQGRPHRHGPGAAGIRARGEAGPPARCRDAGEGGRRPRPSPAWRSIVAERLVQRRWTSPSTTSPRRSARERLASGGRPGWPTSMSARWAR